MNSSAENNDGCWWNIPETLCLAVLFSSLSFISIQFSSKTLAHNTCSLLWKDHYWCHSIIYKELHYGVLPLVSSCRVSLWHVSHFPAYEKDEPIFFKKEKYIWKTKQGTVQYKYVLNVFKEEEPFRIPQSFFFFFDWCGHQNAWFCCCDFKKRKRKNVLLCLFVFSENYLNWQNCRCTKCIFRSDDL